MKKTITIILAVICLAVFVSVSRAADTKEEVKDKDAVKVENQEKTENKGETKGQIRNQNQTRTKSDKGLHLGGLSKDQKKEMIQQKKENKDKIMKQERTRTKNCDQNGKEQKIRKQAGKKEQKKGK